MLYLAEHVDPPHLTLPPHCLVQHQPTPPHPTPRPTLPHPTPLPTLPCPPHPLPHPTPRHPIPRPALLLLLLLQLAHFSLLACTQE